MLSLKLEIRHRGESDPWDVSDIVSSVTYTTDINYTAGELSFDIRLTNSKFRLKNGDVVMYRWNNKKVFYGYVFKWNADESEKASVTAYDKLRYFKNNDSLVMKAGTLAERFSVCLSRAQIRGSAKGVSSGKLKGAVYDNKSYFDILKEAIENTKTNDGKSYFLRDNYGTVELAKVPYKTVDINITDKTNVITYSVSRSIDSAANYIKVVSDDQKSSKKKAATATASGGTVKKWGKLTYVDKPTSTKKMNAGQLKARAESLLKQKNKQSNSLKLKVLGDLNFQAGNNVKLSVDSLKKVGINSATMLIMKATHNFGTNYTVDLEMRV